jgi:hypothetical protein
MVAQKWYTKISIGPPCCSNFTLGDQVNFLPFRAQFILGHPEHISFTAKNYSNTTYTKQSMQTKTPLRKQ